MISYPYTFSLNPIPLLFIWFVVVGLALVSALVRSLWSEFLRRSARASACSVSARAPRQVAGPLSSLKLITS